MSYLPVIVSFICLIFLIYLLVILFILFFIICHCLPHFFSFPLFFGLPYSLQDLDSWAWAPVVGGPSPNCWINTDSQTSWNIIWSKVSWRATSKHLVLALLNCLQTPVLKFSGQLISERRTQFRLTKKITDMTKNMLQTKEQGKKKTKRPHKWRGNRETTWKKI